MNSIGQALRELHRIHRQINDLRERMERGPRQIRANQVRLETLEKELSDAKELYKRGRITADQKQLQLNEREGRIRNLQGKLNIATSNKEFQAIKDQMGADEQANLVLSDELLEQLEKNDQLEAQVGAAHDKLGAAKKEMTETAKKIEAKQVELEGEMARVTQNLHAAAETLPPEFKTDYQRLAQVRGEEALAPVENRTTCGGCFQTITANMYSDVRLNKPVFCRSCGAMLYVPEGEA